MEERGLFRMAAMVLVALVAVSAIAWAVGRDPGKRAKGGNRENDADSGAVPAAAVAQAGDSGRAAAPADAVCTPQGSPRPLDDAIHESSGVAPSRSHAGIFWTHNDSGEPLLYAVDSAGRTAGTVRIAGAVVEDWEDVALAPCPGGDCLYIADIGDNEATRPFITVYRVPEPAPNAAHSAPATALRLRYPDGPHDAEALFVLDGAVHVVTKGESGPVALYRAPAGAGAEATLERVRALSADRVGRRERVTGAAASPDGRWVALRTLRDATLYRAAELGNPRVSPVRVDLEGLKEEQGEGIGFAPGGAIVLTSEGGGKKKPATFARLSCTLP